MRLTSLSGGTFAFCVLAIVVACGGGSDDDDDAPISCTGNADCVSENPCLIGRCGLDGICAFQPAPTGPAPNEQEGDCKRATCRDGQPMYTNDDSDVLDDDEPCTDDTCENGVPMNTLSEDGSSCDVGSGSGVCQQGTCIVLCTESNAASQCDDDDPCTADVCVPCDDEVCNGQGQCGHEAADGEGPDDGNECTTDLCEGGEPVHEPAPVSTACTDGGNVCNAAGDCVECANDDDCADFPVRNCYVPVCDSGECVEALAEEGTIATGADVAGDCRSPVCGSSGSYTNEIDDEDVPDDENPCTVDSCMDGYAMHVPADTFTSCGDGGEVCSQNSECCTPVVLEDDGDLVALRVNYLQGDYFLATFDTMTGASADVASLGISPEHIAHDPTTGHVFYQTGSAVGMLADCGDAELSGIVLPANDTTTPLNFPSAIAWDSGADRLFVVGESTGGVLYTYDPAALEWTEHGTLSSFYPIAAAYLASSDKLYMAASSWASSVRRYSATGTFEADVALTPTLVGTSINHVQIRGSGSSLYYIIQGYDGLNNFYSFAEVNPATGETNVIFP